MRLHYDSMLRLVRKASLGGAKRRSMTEWEWDVSGDCESSATREFSSRPSADDDRFKRKRARPRAEVDADISSFVAAASKVFGGAELTKVKRPKAKRGLPRYISVSPVDHRPPLHVTMHVRCRKCSKCRKVRSRMWYARAMNETMAAARTWFGTITLNPDAAFMSLARARRQCSRKGVIWEEMTFEEQFSELHRQNGLHLQLWLKRVRKESGAPLRFLLVAEAHKSGLPHYHCLVHEVDELRPVRHRVLADQWKLGFTNFKLVTDPKQAGYLCKYLSKSAAARVRASQAYGQRSLAIVKREKVSSEKQNETPTHDETTLEISKAFSIVEQKRRASCTQ